MIVTKNKGFTLIELLVVIAIIGTLASVVLASLNSARVKARDSARSAQVKELKLAMELYYDSNGRYFSSCTGAVYIHQITALNPFIGQLPRDPLYAGTSDDYRYCGNAAGTAYGIRIKYEDTSRPGTDASGYCKTGVNVGASWWGGIPMCQGV